MNAPNLALAYGNSHSQWEFAWALHAGLAYKVTKNFTAEIAYRYVNLGDFQSGDLIGYNGINNYNNPMLFNGVSSQDVKLALRWSLNAGDNFNSPLTVAPAYAPPPVYAPPAPAYSPPPPLMRKG